MIQPTQITWPGKSGHKYTYYIFPRGVEFNPGQPGLYIFVKETRPGYFKPVYIGQTQDLNERLSNHEKQAAVDRAGATHICARVNSAGEQSRLAEEKDLIDQWQPECNVQHIREVAPTSTMRPRNPWQIAVPGQ
jgi:predicted GIY-YIG superfamily endonuclease